MKKENIKLVAIYTRKSKFKEESDSVKNQAQQCMEKIEYLNQNPSDNTLYKVFKVYGDDGFSGKDTDRPEMNNLLDDMENKRFDILMVYKLDRLSRNMKDMLGIVERMDELGIDLLSLKEEHVNTTGAMGKAFFNISLVFAQLERDLASERTKDNARMLVQDGRDMGGVRKYGFNYNRVKDETGKSRNVVTINEEERKVVRYIYDLYLTGQHSVSTIVDMLNKKGVHKPLISSVGATTWVDKNVRTMLKNPCYTENSPEIAAFLTGQGFEVSVPLDKLTGEKSLQKYSKRYELFDVEPIIPAEEWLSVQQIMDNNRNCYVHIGKFQSPYLLNSGISVCKNCGTFLTVIATYRKGREYYYYNCRSKKCKSKAKSYRMEYLDNYVIERLKEFYKETKTIEWLLDEDLKKKSKDPNKIKKEEIEKEIKIIDRKIYNITSLIEGFDSDDEETQGFIQKKQEDLKRLLKEKKTKKESLFEIENSKERVDIYDKRKILESVEMFSELLDQKQETYHLKVVLRYLLDSIVVDHDGNVEIKHKFYSDTPVSNGSPVFHSLHNPSVEKTVKNFIAPNRKNAEYIII